MGGAGKSTGQLVKSLAWSLFSDFGQGTHFLGLCLTLYKQENRPDGEPQTRMPQVARCVISIRKPGQAKQQGTVRPGDAKECMPCHGY